MYCQTSFLELLINPGKTLTWGAASTRAVIRLFAHNFFADHANISLVNVAVKSQEKVCPCMTQPKPFVSSPLDNVVKKNQLYTRLVSKEMHIDPVRMCPVEDFFDNGGSDAEGTVLHAYQVW